MFERLKNKLFHDHHYEPTGKEFYRGINEWHVMKVKEVKCVICKKYSEELISYKRV